MNDPFSRDFVWVQPMGARYGLLTFICQNEMGFPDDIRSGPIPPFRGDFFHVLVRCRTARPAIEGVSQKPCQPRTSRFGPTSDVYHGSSFIIMWRIPPAGPDYFNRQSLSSAPATANSLLTRMAPRNATAAFCPTCLTHSAVLRSRAGPHVPPQSDCSAPWLLLKYDD